MNDPTEASNSLHVVVVTSKGRDKFFFSKDTTVDGAVAEVVDRFGLKGEGTFSLFWDRKNESLTPGTALLADFEIEDGDKLTLTGGGLNV
ncbi:hypothetical protein [Candidatus Palauibacter sp.]|uniref:hypothetical protein n=1 Tax=Candidatus Palauibacter sp. TaxID=3101350 RepID=UPI003B01528D